MTEHLSRPDPVPKLRSAGFQSIKIESAAACLVSDDYGPGTPPHLKKYRKSH